MCKDCTNGIRSSVRVFAEFDVGVRMTTSFKVQAVFAIRVEAEICKSGFDV